LITTMIMSGTVQFSGAGAESVVAARIEGGDVALIGCPADTDVVHFIARSEIKNAASLKGKNSPVLQIVLKELSLRRSVPKEFFGRSDLLAHWTSWSAKGGLNG
jgi:hypothetical protein